MKVKEININATIAWSPKCQTPSYLACGTSSQQIDTSSNSSTLQIYNLNLGQDNLEAKLQASIGTPARFHKLAWSLNNEFLAGACENNSIYIYSPSKLCSDDTTNALLTSMENKHSGPVHSVDFNRFQHFLIASGSVDGEISIWDITKPKDPVTNCNKPNVSAFVSCISWNRQVENILAATHGDRCVVYDLKKNNSPIVGISESVSRIRPHSICWHPTMATQLVLSSDNDQTPVAQLWDLRYITAPIKTLNGHQRGIIATAWCEEDPDIFLTSGKDNRILIWNPNNDKNVDIVGELPSYNQWSFDVSFSPRDPALVAASSVDGTVSIYSLMGGGYPPTQTDKFSAIADSFPGMELPAAIPQAAEPQPIHLKNPPKWSYKKSGVSFVFGGRLLSWNRNSRSVEISQVITEPELINRSTVLENALGQQDLGAYCINKAQNNNNQNEQSVWQFIGATFSIEGTRDQYMNLLGYDKNQVATKVRPQTLGPSPEELAAKMSSLATAEGSTSSLDPSEQFEMIASAHSLDKTPEPETGILENDSTTSSPVLLGVSADTEGMIRHALLVGDFESAIELCLQEGNHSHALILATHAGGEIYYKTRDKILLLENSNLLSSLVGSLVQHDLTNLVTSCSLDNWKEALVALLTYGTHDEFSPLAEMLGERLESTNNMNDLYHAMICYVCAGALSKFVACWVKTQPNIETNSTNLQDLVEVVMVLQKALHAIGRVVNLSEDATVSQHMCQYASLLAAQGALTTAASYLNNATQGEMLSLKERVFKALGYNTNANQGRTQAQAAVQGRARNLSVTSTHSQLSRKCSTPQPSSYQQPQQFTPSVQAQQANYQSSPNPAASLFSTPQAPGYPMSNLQQPMNMSFNPGSPMYGTPTGMMQPQPIQSQPPPMMTPMMPAPTNVPSGPPPTATGSIGGMRKATGGRYTNDTSSTNPTNPASIPGMFTPGPNTNQFPGGPQPTHYPASPQPMFPGGAQQYNVPQASVKPFNPPVPGMSNPGSLGPPQPSNVQPNILEPQQPQYPQAPAMTPAALDNNVPRGWNDPPPLIKKNKQNQQHQVNQDQPKPMQPVQPMLNPAVGAPQEPPQQFQGFQGFQPTNQGTVSPAVTPAPVPPPAPVEKAKIPIEDQIIQEVLDGIRSRALMTVSNTMAKQRLENLGPKIEVLYDKLRAQQVSPSTLSGLHNIVMAVKTGDYHTALQVHTATVATGNFSEMSQYMPPLKMLLTTCMQFQVFLQ